MIHALYDIFFGCRHRRTSFPHRPSTRPGEPQGEMYVVCLDCGKRFHYDWELMRTGAPIAPEPPAEDIENGRGKKVRYLVALSTLPAIWLIARHKRSKSGKEQSSEPKS